MNKNQEFKPSDIELISDIIAKVTDREQSSYYMYDDMYEKYGKQKRAQDMEEWRYIDAKWMNRRSWIAIALSATVFLLELLEKVQGWLAFC